MAYGLLHVLTVGCGLIFVVMSLWSRITSFQGLSHSFWLSSALWPDAVNDLFNHIIVSTIKGNADIRDVLEEKET
jgi:hypothetical protein